MIPEPLTLDDLLAFIRGWFRLLAAERWGEAVALLDEPNSYGIQWTTAGLHEALDLTYPPGCRFRIAHPEGPRVSDPDAAVGTLHADVVAFDDDSGYSANHDVPLNGAWSDLTAQFEFLRRPGGLSVVLHDLHVL